MWIGSVGHHVIGGGEVAIEWVESYEAAVDQAKRQQRILFLDFHKTPG